MSDDPRASLSTLQSYRHYRGGTYTLLHVAENSENRAELMAVYVSHLSRKVLVRPWAMFRELVEWADGVRRPRFAALLSPEDDACAELKRLVDEGVKERLTTIEAILDADELRERAKP